MANRDPPNAAVKDGTVRASVRRPTGPGWPRSRSSAGVVGQHRALQPGAGGAEVPGWNVVHARAHLQVADGQLDGGVVAVELVDLGDMAIEVGQEPEVAPVGPQTALTSHPPLRAACHQLG